MWYTRTNYVVHQNKLCGTPEQIMWYTRTNYVVHQNKLCGTPEQIMWYTRTNCRKPEQIMWYTRTNYVVHQNKLCGTPEQIMSYTRTNYVVHQNKWNTEIYLTYQKKNRNSLLWTGINRKKMFPKFSKNLKATSKFWAPEGWSEADYILGTHKHLAPLYKI